MTPRFISKNFAIPNRASRSALLLPVLIPAMVLGCNQPPPPGSDTMGDDTTDEDTDVEASGTSSPDTDETDDTSETDDATETEDTDDTTDLGEFADTLYPLADGAHWTYRIKNINGQVLGMDIVDATEVEWEGQTAWMLEDNPGGSGEWTQAVITHDGTLSSRVHKDVMTDTGSVQIVDYDPGFARVDDTWDTVGFSEELLYDRIEYDGNGLNPVIEPRGHIFTVIAVNEQITVPAGTFDCVQIERVRSVGGAAGEIVVSWYAFGVGKVREERPAESVIEELASVSLPGGVNLP
jgi:hypothetical protein